METTLQAQIGLPRTHKRFVDQVQRVASPPARGLTRETLVLAIDAVEVEVEVERQERPRGGAQGYWHCPQCDRRCCHLFIVAGVLRCRKCHSLTYRSQHTLHPALIRAAKIRRKLGASASILTELPKRPPHWRSDYWQRSLRDLAAAEGVIVELLSATLREVKRQKVKLDGR